MTDLSQEIIFSLIVKAFFSGAALGVLYEAVRLSKLLLKSDKSRVRHGILCVFIFLTDFLFCIIAASVALLLTYNLSAGIFRGCMYGAMGAGLLCYRVTLGRIMCKIELWAANLIKKICRFVLKIILFPLRVIFSLFVKLYGLTIGRIIGKMRYRMKLKKQKKQIESENIGAAALLPESTVGEENNVDKDRGYGKEGRINFGGCRRA